ncbi:MAG: hypothetical protein ACP5HK_07050 [Acidilobus sp.]
MILAPWESRSALTAQDGSTITGNSGRGLAILSRAGGRVALKLEGRAFEVKREVLEEHSRRRSYLVLEGEGAMRWG